MDRIETRIRMLIAALVLLGLLLGPCSNAVMTALPTAVEGE